MKNAFLFIDGNNVYHNLKDMYIKPGNLNSKSFEKLIILIADHFKCNITKTFYYNSLPDIRDGKDTYWSHMSYMDSLKKTNFEVILRRLQSHTTKEHVKEKQEIIETLELCKNCKPIVKANCSDCIGVIKKKEKGVDVRMAIDIVKKALYKEYDILSTLKCGVSNEG
jgi:uncharacterized LabA/DUF88 family protein